MKTHFLLQKVWNDLLFDQTGPRKDPLQTIKTAKTVSTLFCAFTFGFTLVDIHNGNWARPLGLLGACYLSYEVGTVAENIRQVIENPLKEIRTLYAACDSDEKVWRTVTIGAPVARSLGLAYLRNLARQSANNTTQLYNRIWKIFLS